MKKILIGILLPFLFFVGTRGVFAATSASIQVTTSRATLTVTSNEHIGQVWGNFSCGGLGSKKIEYSASASPSTSQSFTINFSSGKTGTYTCQVSNLEVGLLESQNFVNPRVTSKTITLGSSSSNKTSSSSKNTSSKNTNNNDDSKSSDTALKSLMVEGKNLNPEFNKDVTSYNLTVDNSTKKIKINAEATDSKATVAGTGEKTVNEGDNKFDIVVTAENGDKKTYTINITVDTKPIIVKLGGKEYNVVKKKEELPQLDIKHEDMTLNIEEQDIPAYRIDKLNYVLVGLKDSDGKVRLYIFESYKDSNKPFKYTLFRQLKFSQAFVSYLEFPKNLIPKGYKKYKVKINDEEIEVYKLNKNSKYSLFYGVNIETGEKSIYKYDSKENTIQRYDREELKGLEKKLEENKLITVGFVGLSALLLIIIVLMIATRRIKKKKSVKYSKTLK